MFSFQNSSVYYHIILIFILILFMRVILKLYSYLFSEQYSQWHYYSLMSENYSLVILTLFRSCSFYSYVITCRILVPPPCDSLHIDLITIIRYWLFCASTLASFFWPPTETDLSMILVYVLLVSLLLEMVHNERQIEATSNHSQISMKKLIFCYIFNFLGYYAMH